jgi:hypothetical protein
MFTYNYILDLFIFEKEVCMVRCQRTADYFFQKLSLCLFVGFSLQFLFKYCGKCKGALRKEERSHFMIINRNEFFLVIRNLHFLAKQTWKPLLGYAPYVAFLKDCSGHSYNNVYIPRIKSRDCIIFWSQWKDIYK